MILRRGLALMALLTAPPLAASPPRSPVGRWVTEDGSAIVAIAPCGTSLCGRIVRVLRRDPAAAVTDIHNPDPRLRARRAADVAILSDFAHEDRTWRGTIYDPRSGRTYRAFLDTADGQRLEVRGCVLMLCRSQMWRRDRSG